MTQQPKTNLGHFHNYLRKLESPTHFITWQYYAMVAAVLGRKVWRQGGVTKPEYEGTPLFPVFPNLYVWYVGDASVGKSFPADTVYKILEHTKAPLKVYDPIKKTHEIIFKPVCNLLPKSGTLEGILREAAAMEDYIKLDNEVYLHTSMMLFIPGEAGVLLKKDTNDIVTFLTDGFDCGSYKRRLETKKSYEFKNMCLTLSFCSTPDWVSRNVDDSLVDMGFTSRVIFLYGEKPRFATSNHAIEEDQKPSLRIVKDHIIKLAGLYGQVTNTPAAEAWWHDWVQNRWELHHPLLKTNKDPRLNTYYGRKRIHLMKMAMLCHFAEKTSMVLDVSDYQKALAILDEAELTMHRALASCVINPVGMLVEKVRDQLRSFKEMSDQDILLKNLNTGDEHQIQRAINILVNTEQAVKSGEKGRFKFYKIVESTAAKDTGYAESPLDLKLAAEAIEEKAQAQTSLDSTHVALKTHLKQILHQQEIESEINSLRNGETQVAKILEMEMFEESSFLVPPTAAPKAQAKKPRSVQHKTAEVEDLE